MPREESKPSISLDLGTFDSFLEQAEFPMIPEGNYHLRIKDWNHAVSKGDEQMVYWDLEVIDAEVPEHNGHVISMNTMLEGSGRVFLSRFVASVHNPSKDVDLQSRFNPDQLDDMFNDMIGLTLVGDVEISEYDGTKRNQVAKTYRAE